ncbi:MAG: PA14 domain-containing protein [Akkermansia sp.]
MAPSPSVKMNGPRKRGVELTGYVKVPADGEYTFYLSTDANKGSKAFVRLHGMELIDADKTYEPGSEVSSDLGDRKNPVYLKLDFIPSALAMWELRHCLQTGFEGKVPVCPE